MPFFRGHNLFKTAAVAAGAIGLTALLWPAGADANQLDGEPVDPPVTTKPDDNAGDAELQTVEQYNRQRLDRNRRGMSVLLGWSLVNMGAGTAGFLLSDGPTRHFHGMNAMWNVVNAIIAGFGYRDAATTDPGDGDAMDALDDTHSFEKVLLFNAGLNTGYIAAGAFLWERGRRTGSEQLQGFGPAVALQGLFLLGFDTTMFLLSRRHRQQFEITVAPQLTTPGVSTTIRF